MFGWLMVIISGISAVVLMVMSFFIEDANTPGGATLGHWHFLIPVALGWLALVPRSKKELVDLFGAHPLAQRFFGRKPGSFYGDYRRKMTGFGKVLLFGSVALFALVIWRTNVNVGLFVAGFFFVGTLCFWVMRLEINGDPYARQIRRIASALVYRPLPAERRT